LIDRDILIYIKLWKWVEWWILRSESNGTGLGIVTMMFFWQAIFWSWMMWFEKYIQIMLQT